MATKKTINKKTYAPIPEHIEPTDIIMVRNGFSGKLVYVNPRTQERFAWDSFGDEVEMELRELRNAKGSQKAFFENNWFMFDDEYSWIIPYLGVTKYYDNALSIDEIEKIFTKAPATIRRICDELNEGQRESVVHMARAKYALGEIDSLKTIGALEEGLGINLTER